MEGFYYVLFQFNSGSPIQPPVPSGDREAISLSPRRAQDTGALRTKQRKSEEGRRGQTRSKPVTNVLYVDGKATS